MNRQVQNNCAMYLAQQPKGKLCTFRDYNVCNKILLVCLGDI